MSTPQGPRDTGNNRGRGRGRPTFRTRGGRNEVVEEHQPNRRAPHSSRGSDSPSRQARNAPPRQNEGRSSKQRPREVRTPPASRTHSRRSSYTSPAPPIRPPDASWRNPAVEPTGSYQGDMSDLYQKFKKNREQERKDAIRNGTLADPDKPTSLANAITTVGTCKDMCPEFERVERIVQNMVDGAEKTTSSSNTKVPDEKHMVKRFRRSAAGYDEQLPSDIRPPRVLQMTLNYLFDEVVGGAQLATVHKFVWDRTRSIRNDFSIQRVTKLDDLKIAIDCFERIARFHILSLHQLSRQDEDNGEFDHHQEREQLNNTLLSLMYYYDDSRPRLTSANEAEFRAYCIIFEIQDQRPDLEDRVQNWPRSLVNDRRVQTALKIYAASSNTVDEQGPLRPRTSFSIAQANSGRFWALVQSKAVPYLMACVAEIYFHFIRSTTLETILTAYKVRRTGRQPQDWVLDDLTYVLGFDNENQTRTFCEDHGFSVLEKESGESFLELGSVTGRSLTDSNFRRKQIFSQAYVESKRLGRTLPAVINGLSASEAQAQGLVQDPVGTMSSPGSNEESLFITGHSDDDAKKGTQEAYTSQPKVDFLKKPAGLDPSAQPFVPPPTIFGTPSSKPNPFAKVGTFGLPTPLTSASQPSNASATLKPSTPNSSGSNPFDKPPKFNFRPDKTATDTKDSSTLAPNTTPPAAPLVQESTTPEGPPLATFKVPVPFEMDVKLVKNFVGTGHEGGKPSNEPISSPQPPNNKNFSPQVSLAPSAQATNRTATNSVPLQWPKPPETTKTATTTGSFNTPFFQWPKPNTATQALQINQNLTSISEAPKSPKTQELSSPFAFLNEPVPSTADNFKTSSPFPAPNNNSPPVDPSGLSSHSAPSQTTPRLPKLDLTQPATESSKNSQELASKLTPVQQLPSLPELRQFPFKPATTPAEQAKIKPPTPDPRPAILEDLTNSLMMGENGLLHQFIEYTLSSVVKNAFRQVEDEQSWKRAGEVRAVLLSKKYFKKWKKIAWGRGLRRGREERRKLAQLMREMARNSPKRREDLGTQNSPRQQENLGTKNSPRQQEDLGTKNSPRQQEDLGRSLLVKESGGGVQETHSMAPPSRKKRKSQDCPDLHSQEIAETPLSKKQRREEKIQRAQLRASRRIEHHHNRSKTLKNPISSSRVGGHSKSRYSIHPDFSHLGDGSILSHSVLQKARHLVPSIKTDTTRTNYFLLKSRGIDSNTTVVPPTSRKRPRDEPQPEGIKIRKPSPPDAYSHAIGKSSANGVKVSASAPATKSSAKVRPSASAPAVKISANIIRPSTSAAATSSATNDVQISKSAPAAADGDYDSDEALFAQARAIREAMAEDIVWYRAEREKSRISAATSSSSAKSKKRHASRKETEKERRLREFKSTPSRTEQRLKATKANGFLPDNFSGLKEMRAVKANTKATRSPERAIARPFMTDDEDIDMTDWDGEETSGEYGDEDDSEHEYEYANSAKGKGSSFEDAIEL